MVRRVKDDPVGFVDSYGRDHVKGWAWDPLQPEVPVQVQLRTAGHIIATVRADQFRADVALPGVRTGRQGFELRLEEPLSFEDLRTIEVAIEGTDIVLPQSAPIQIEPELPPVYDRLLVPRCESPFLERIIERDGIDGDRARMLREFSERGLLRIRIDDPGFDRLANEIIESLGGEYQGQRRIQDAWTFNKAVATLACLPQVLQTLELLYGRAPIPMQTLNFPVGTEQSTHSDSIHFNCHPKRYMCGVWVALEPITLDNGPLHYYPGSHRFPVIDLDDLGLVAEPGRWSANYEAHQEVLHELVRVAGCSKETLIADRGDAIIWAANLCHGGEPIRKPGSSRHSQVTHYYFEGCAYYSPMASNVFLGRIRRPDRRDIRTGEPVLPTFGHAQIPIDIPLDTPSPTPAAGAEPSEPRSRYRRPTFATSTVRRTARTAADRWSRWCADRGR